MFRSCTGSCRGVSSSPWAAACSPDSSPKSNTPSRRALELAGWSTDSAARGPVQDLPGDAVATMAGRRRSRVAFGRSRCSTALSVPGVPCPPGRPGNGLLDCVLLGEEPHEPMIDYLSAALARNDSRQRLRGNRSWRARRRGSRSSVRGALHRAARNQAGAAGSAWGARDTRGPRRGSSTSTAQKQPRSPAGGHRRGCIAGQVLDRSTSWLSPSTSPTNWGLADSATVDFGEESGEQAAAHGAR